MTWSATVHRAASVQSQQTWSITHSGERSWANWSHWNHLRILISCDSLVILLEAKVYNLSKVTGISGDS